MAEGLSRLPGVQAVALKDIYDRASAVPDTQWIEDAGREGWIVFTQNVTMGQDPVERAAIVTHGTHVFSLSKADWPSFVQGVVFGRNILRIGRRCRRADGCFWRISERPPRKDVD